MPQQNKTSNQISASSNELANQQVNNEQLEYVQEQLEAANNISQNPFAVFLIKEGEQLVKQSDVFIKFTIAWGQGQDSAELQQQYMELHQESQDKVIKTFELYIKRKLDYAKQTTNQLAKLEWYEKHELFFYKRLLKKIKNIVKHKTNDKQGKSCCQTLCYGLVACMLCFIRFLFIVIMHLLMDIRGKDCMFFMLSLRLAWVEGYTKQVQKTIDQQAAFIVSLIYIAFFISGCIIKECEWTQKAKQLQQRILRILTPT